MATTNLNAIILAAARKLKDQRSSAGAGDDSGKRYVSALLTEYANRAVRDLIRELFEVYRERIGDVLPEYMKTSGTLSLTNGVVTPPPDLWYAMDLVKSDRTVKFHKLESEQVETVWSGQDKLIVPSATRPVFWQEAQKLYTLGLTNDNVIVRYLRAHLDIGVVTTTLGVGKYLASGAFIYNSAGALGKIVYPDNGVMSVNFAAGDIGKWVSLFIGGFGVALARITNTFASVPSVGIVIEGDGLPSGTSGVTQILMSDLQPDGNDLILSPQWHGEIINRVVQFGVADATNGLV